MQSMAKSTAILLITLGALAAPQAARADAKEEARKHYDRAIELVDDGQLEGAIVEFQRSYDLTHHFAVLYNIGQVFVSLANPVEAVDAYQRYLADGGKRIPAARRAEVQQEVARQKARIATLEIRGLPDGATVRVDGKEIGKAPIAAPVRVGVGTHNIAASAEGHDPAETQVTVAGEDRRVVDLVLVKHVVEPPPPPVMAPVALAVPESPVVSVSPPVVLPAAREPTVISAPVELPTRQQSVSKLRVAGIVSAAVGVAGLAAGTACWLVAKSRHNDAVTDWKQHLDDRAQSLQSEAHDLAIGANISFIAGGTLAALGVVLYIVGAPDGQAPTRPDPHVHLMPALAPGFAGLNAGGTW
jgi:hypothetical protein